ncbi:hypothetical protein [Sphingobacterium sp. BN32]|uniref:hypothetical protein n=1 Tax=Sphingobacterium sp. BN32 TaxID=3058432 RepID=UPI00265D2761|nr:hypothetical protein [Sphingobacterium sp. BN32]WKK58551.1 hypothetical protein QYC40_18170 [Sphingobacterium sp. BN32]
MVDLFIQNLQQAIKHQSIYNEDLIRHLVNAIIVIAGRSIAVVKPSGISSTSEGGYCRY